MRYVYLLESLSASGKRYVGMTTDLRARLSRHNSCGSPHTAKYVPWKLVTYLAFVDAEQAIAFERYLKTGSGQAFANKRLWSTHAAASRELPSGSGDQET
jgi:putative endonuclease